MVEGSHRRCIFPLTSLQIGDMQSYFANLSLFLAYESGKLYILVDNRPRKKEQMSNPTHWWQLMVHKSRLSPFAKMRVRKKEKILEKLASLKFKSSSDITQSTKWFALTDAMALSRHRAFLPVKKLRKAIIENSKLLHRLMYGLIVFEVTWSDVRGLNYLNELQTDTSLAIETKIMRRWEFDSLAHAAKNTLSWFPGTANEHIILKEHLEAAIEENIYDAKEQFPKTEEEEEEKNGNNMLDTNDSLCPASSSFSSNSCPDNLHGANESFCSTSSSSTSSSCPETEIMKNRLQKSTTPSDEAVETTVVYRNVLIIFRFNDAELPFRLKDIIISELWLLTLLEAGLPSWAIFMQSYPGFCRLYRTWMCPLARVLYVTISFVTVAIGFYDLYKNIPLLKATASHLFGPLFDWIEAWEMVSRIRYLGTMLFLHNFQKAFKCVLVVTRTIVSFLLFFFGPFLRPIIRILECCVPVLSVVMEVAENCFSVIWMVLDTCVTVVGDVIEILILPFWYIFATASKIIMSLVYPIYWLVFYAPFKLVHGAVRIFASAFKVLYNVVGAFWLSARGIFHFSRGVETTVTSVDTSMWRTLWNDLFSQVFQALRSILNGLLAFFMACNRHRLSIYNHVMEFIKRSIYAIKRACRKENAETQELQLTETRVSCYPVNQTESNLHAKVL